MFNTIDDLQKALAEHGYVAERGLATSLYLSLKLPKPLFLEGEAGVGKTEVAKTLAAILGTSLIRLQCYEGLDVSTAVYEWNYARQMIRIRFLEAQGERSSFEEAHLFGPDFLIKRPLLQAVTYEGEGRPVLLIDELDRADEEFEAFLLELLADFQITVPEVGTFRPAQPPAVVITSNRTREIHDALKRRCLYHWIEYPTFDKEVAVLQTRLPQAPRDLALQVVGLVQQLRRMDLYKLPGVAETLDWAAALLALEQQTLTVEVVSNTLGALLKHQEDIERLQGQMLEVMVQKAQQEAVGHGA
ncbi:MAG TPA: MoxR family ATPase [Chloroflexia bacterium]|nr:MoxR family ATPase [Chloroflexia bacterium]